MKFMRDRQQWPRFMGGKPIEAAKDDTSLTKLLKLRHNAILQELRRRVNYWLQNSVTLNELHDTAQRLSQARLELTSSVEDRVNFLKDKLEFYRFLESHIQWKDKQQRTTRTLMDIDYVASLKLDCEIELVREENKKAKPVQGE